MFKIAFHPLYKHPVPDNHRFPMAKYELLPQQLLYEGVVQKEQFIEPDFPDLKSIYAVHDKTYVTDFINLNLDARAARKVGFVQNKQLVERELLLVQGTIDAALMALNDGVAFNIAGGTHHAFSDRGEAFCMLNDQAVAARYLIDHHEIKQVLIIDLDVHQGNGTAEIFSGFQPVFTFSMHGKTNYPFKKEQSDLDIALEDGTDDATYLQILNDILPDLIEKIKPDFIFYQAGVDILASDKLGKINCTIEGCKQRDALVFSLCKKHNIPVQCSMGGGYSPHLSTILQAHAHTYKVAKDLF